MKQQRDALTSAELRSALYYDQDLGWFLWLIRPQVSSKVRAGDVAGKIDSKGYVTIGFRGHQYRAHRLAWLYMTGSWPPNEIDHEDRVRCNNHWPNLRLATTGQNRQNMTARSDSKSGITGVSWEQKRGQWLGQITVARVRKHLGYFATMEEAAEARRQAEALLFSHSKFSKT